MSDIKPPQDLATGEPIAIVGIGCMFPKSPDLNTYWQNIKTGRDAISEIPDSHWKADDYFDPDPSTPDKTYARRGGFLDPVAFNPLHYGIAPNTIEAIDSSQLLTLVAAEQALVNAGYSVRQNSGRGRTFDRSRTSVMLGVTGTLELVIPLGARLGHPRWRKALLEAGIPAATTEEIISRIAAGYVPWQEQSFPGLLGNVTAGRIANRLDLGGANCVVDAACASSISAIHMAVMELSLGRCDMALSGGVDTFNDIFMYMCFSKTPALSASGDVRPFSADADGTMLGEGIGILVLKRLADARRDGDPIQAIIKGIGASSDGAGNAIYAPSSNGQSRALRAAYREAGVTPRSIELLEAHGTGTRVGDQVEADALSAVFSEDADWVGDSDSDSEGVGEYRSWCALGSVKSMIGHTKAAAGVAGVIKTVLALQHKVLPPTLKVSTPLDTLAPGHSPVYLNTTARPWVAQPAHPRRAAVSAFGFGGSNFHCVLEEAQTLKQAPDWNGEVQLIAFSGDTRQALREQLAAFQQTAGSPDKRRWDEVRRRAKQTREQFSTTHHCRLAFVLRSEQLENERLFEELQSLLDDGRPVAPTTRAYYAEGPPAGRLGLVFPGQGSQRTNMLRDLSCLFPSMLNRWQQVNEAQLNCADSIRISERVYPLPVFNDNDAHTQSEALRATHVAQPALAAASLGVLDIFAQFGLRAEAFAGHSFGEFIALYAAGAISDTALLRLALDRGDSMRRACAGNPGGMLAVNAEPGAVEDLLGEASLNLAIANHNSPSQVVLSGAGEELEKARIYLSSRGLHPVSLNVAGAFHSPLMEPAREQFSASLDETEFSRPDQPVYSNVSAMRYPAQEAEIRSLLAAQITAPVRFVDMIRAMYNDGIHTFVEAGPGKVLQSLIGAILKDHPHRVIALDAGCGHGPELMDLGSTLAQLAAAGHEIDLRQWDPAPPVAVEQDGFCIQISGANHFEAKTLPAMQHPLAARDALPGVAKPQPSSPPPATEMREPANHETNSDLIQTTLLALQKMQHETSELHRHYLESQQSAQRSIELLIRQQLRTGGETAAEPETDAIPSGRQARLPETAISTPIAAEPDPVAAGTTAREPSEGALAMLLDIVAEKTGYPREVLTPEMSLDSDLGIDSIKRVEIFSALAEDFPAIAALSADEAGALDTLQQIEARLSNTLSEPVAPVAEPRQQIPSDAAAGDETRLTGAIISVIADKTGYPPEALNPAMRLDEDLGIDSIKRVEILSALQDKFPALHNPETDAVGALQTIADIALLLDAQAPETRPPDLKRSEPAMDSVVTAASGGGAGIDVKIRQVIADKTGYPAEMLDSTMQLEADLGIDSIKRVEIFSSLQELFPHAPVVEPDAMVRLQSIGAIIAYLGDDSATLSNSPVDISDPVAHCSKENRQALPHAAPASLPTGTGNLEQGLHRLVLKSTTANLAERKPIPFSADAVIGILADGTDLGEPLRLAFEQRGIFSKVIGGKQTPVADEITGLLIISPEQMDTDGLTDAFKVIRAYGAQLQRAGAHGPALLVTVSRLNGHFGLGPGAIEQPLSAGLGGIIKTAAREWTQVRCKSIDISGAWEKRHELADAIVSEVLLDGPLEVGLSHRGPTGLELAPEPLPGADSNARPLLNPGDLVLVSGGARGISAAIAIALAHRYQPTLLLLGRSPEATAEAGWLQGIHGESAIKRAIHQHHTEAGSPQEIERLYRLTIANREMLQTLAALKASGANALYRSVDIRSREDLARNLEDACARYGPLRGIVHGAGILADSLIMDKSDSQFAAVLATKCDGFINLLAALKDQDPAFIVACSSTTARLGRRGQADYAAANECLNKLAQQATRQHPGSKVLSLNWGPWDGGMVDARLKSVFHKEGVGLIPLGAGAEYLIRELECGPSSAVELVVLGPTPQTAPTCSAQPLNEQALSEQALSEQESPAPGGHARADLQHCFSQDVSLTSMPILASHVINARAVVPVALIIEWLAHGALHASPGLRFIGLEDFRVYKGITLESGQRLKIRVLAGAAQPVPGNQGHRELITVELRSETVLHARARIHLGEAYPSTADQQPTASRAAYSQHPYSDSSLFHGPDLQGITRITGCDGQGITGETNTAPEPAAWLKEPLRTQWLADPLVLDAGFQMMILWSEHIYSHCSLPTAIGRLDLYAPFPSTPVTIEAQLQNHQAHKANARLDFRDGHGALIARIEDYECIIDVSLKAGFARNTLAGH